MSLNYLIKPNIQTRFYIDYAWWKTSRDDLHIYLLTHLSQDQQLQLEHRDLHEVFDYIDPTTGEVLQLDTLGLALKESSKSEDFISEHIGLIDSVFRALLVKGNKPLNALELAEITGRDAQTILKTIGGVRVYRGIRPHHPSPDGES